MSKKLKCIIISLFSTILAMILAFAFSLLYIEESNIVAYKDSCIDHVRYDIIRPIEVSKYSLKQDVDNLFSTSYSFEECDLVYPTRGHADVLSRHISVDKDLSCELFVFVLAHEICHIKYLTLGERFCNIKAWLTLYQSSNDYFKNIALMIADYDLHGSFDEEYSFVGHIEHYIPSELKY